MTTKQMHKNRGSALLMVVGLLTILALLGGTFLVISRYERKQALALESQPDPDAYAKAIAEMVQVKLLDDLFITSGSSTPYSNANETTRTHNWLRYIDCAPGDHIDDNDNYWLASSEPDSSNTWIQMTGILSDDSSDTRLNKAYTAADDDGYAAISSIPYFDTDSDGYIDAKLSDLDVTMPSGDSYVAAVRVVDLSGLINVNTAGEIEFSSTDPWTAQSVPALVDMRGLFENGEGGATGSHLDQYGEINNTSDNNGRFGSIISISGTSAQTLGASTMLPYYNNCAVKMLNSATGYKPYAISDETYLRNYNSDATASGRLADNTGDLNWNVDSVANKLIRKYLTTYNCSRSLPRHYDTDNSTANKGAAFTQRLFINNNGSTITSTNANPLGTPNTNPTGDSSTGDTLRQRLYYELCRAAGQQAGSTATSDLDVRKIIAQYVANLWAATCTQWPEQEDFAFAALKPSDGSAESFGTVYGLTPTLVISEAFAVQFQPSLKNGTDGLDTDTTPGADTWYNSDGGAAYAIEIYNPTNQNILLTNYQLICNGVTLNLSTVASNLPAGEKLVVYSFHGDYYDGSNATALTSGELFNMPATETWYEWSSLNFNAPSSGTTKLAELKRTFTMPSPPTLCIDYVTADDLDWVGKDYTWDGPTTTSPLPNETSCSVTFRDDSDLDRAIVRKFSDPTNPVTGTITPNAARDSANVKLNASNGITSTTAGLTTSDVYGGFSMDFETDGIQNFSEFLNIYIVGPSTDTANYLCDAFITYKTNTYRARVNLSETIPSANCSAYPDVSWICILPELTEVLERDTERENISGQPTRVYGRVNINTAPANVLKRLPFYLDINLNGQYDTGEDFTTLGLDVNTLVDDYIVAYREDNSTTGKESIVGLTGLRTAADPFRGFATPGEIALPMLAYFLDTSATTNVTTVLAAHGITPEDEKYAKIRSNFYGGVANLVTVNSDAFAAYITIGIKEIGAGSDKPTKAWRYLAVFDRGNCRSDSDKPEMLMMTPIGSN